MIASKIPQESVFLLLFIYMHFYTATYPLSFLSITDKLFTTPPRIHTLHKTCAAYDVLSDQDKRKQYDRFGAQGASQEGSPFDFDAFFRPEGDSGFHHHAHFNFHKMFDDFFDDNFFQHEFGGDFFQGHHPHHHHQHTGIIFIDIYSRKYLWFSSNNYSKLLWASA